MPRYALLLAYEGGDFAGWQSSGRRSVSSELAAALKRLGEAAAPQGASRTDAGVHARGQVAHIDCTRAWEPAHLARSLNHQLPPDVACPAAAAVADDFHAQHDARGKTYSYRLDLGAVPNPFWCRSGYRPAALPDPALLERCAAMIPGHRDWVGFARRGEQREDLVRRIERVEWRFADPAATCEISGTAFTYRLVRSLVGAMIAVANGTCSEAELRRSLAGEETPAGRQQAPARGLCLEAVRYAVEPPWRTPAES